MAAARLITERTASAPCCRCTDSAGAGRGVVPYQRARELVNAAVPQHVEAWAGIIGLKSADGRFQRTEPMFNVPPAVPATVAVLVLVHALIAQFRDDITEALHACMRAHEAAPYRSRWSDVRTDFVRVAEAARAVTRDLRNLRAGFDALPP